MLSQNLTSYCYPNLKYLVIGYLEPLGNFDLFADRRANNLSILRNVFDTFSYDDYGRRDQGSFHRGHWKESTLVENAEGILES